MFRNFLKAMILGLNDIYADNLVIPATNYNKPNFKKSKKHRKVRRGKLQDK